MKEIGIEIKKRRKEFKLTQEALAKEVDCCGVTVGHVEAGKSVATGILKRICDRLGLKIGVSVEE